MLWRQRWWWSQRQGRRNHPEDESLCSVPTRAVTCHRFFEGGLQARASRRKQMQLQLQRLLLRLQRQSNQLIHQVLSGILLREGIIIIIHHHFNLLDSPCHCGNRHTNTTMIIRVAADLGPYHHSLHLSRQLCVIHSRTLCQMDMVTSPIGSSSSSKG